jgi:uncharacterized protein
VADDYRHKIICDPVHSEIPISRLEQRLIDAPSFQRLRNLKQLGLATLVYPNSSHSRFAHSLGVFRIMSRIIDLLVEKGRFKDADRRIMRVAALLHDIGHYPYSHLMEYIDRDKHRPSYLSRANTKGSAQPEKTTRYPDHEKIGQLAITKRPDIASVLTENEIDPEQIASIIRGEHSKPAYNQLIHSSLDMDRMDYMVRDSLGTGVPYGHIDLHYLLSNLDVTDEDAVVVSYKAAAAAEHFLVARYFMYKTVYMHKTIFAFEALLRHILFLLREHGAIPNSGEAIEELVLGDTFLSFHDGYVDDLVEKYSRKSTPKDVVPLCKALRARQPPCLVHEVSALTHQSQGPPAEYALFTQNRAKRIGELADEFKIGKSRWIWEDPKDIRFEALGPFVPLSQASDVKPEEAAELIQVREKDGTIRKLVEDKNSILHHLSQLRLRMSRLYVVGVDDKALVGRIQSKVKAWCKAD